MAFQKATCHILLACIQYSNGPVYEFDSPGISNALSIQTKLFNLCLITSLKLSDCLHLNMFAGQFGLGLGRALMLSLSAHLAQILGPMYFTQFELNSIILISIWVLA